MNHRILLKFTFLLLFTRSFCYCITYFQSDFEAAEVFVSDTIKLDATEITLIEHDNIRKWPEKDGRGIICDLNESAYEQFTYQMQMGNRFIGVSGLNQMYFPYSIVKFGTAKAWHESSPDIEAVLCPVMGEGCCAEVKSPNTGFVALTHPLDSLSNAWVSFNVRFSKKYLTSGEGGLFHALHDNRVGEPFFHFGINRGGPARFVFLLGAGHKMDSVQTDVPVIGDDVYAVTYYIELSRKCLVRVWINRRFADAAHIKASGHIPRIDRIRFYTRQEASYFIDKVSVTDRFEGFVPRLPGQPQLAGEDLVLKNPGDVLHQLEWKIIQKDNPVLPIVHSLQKNSTGFQVPLNQVVNTMGDFLCMARIISPFGKTGPWSPPLAFRMDASRLDQNDPVIRQAIFLSANGARKTDRLVPGKWYTLHLSLGLKGFEQDLGIAMYSVSANKAKQWFFHKPYDPRRSFLINLALNRKSVWGPQRASSTNFRELTGRRGLYLDGTLQGFTIDRKQGKAELKFRFPQKAERGPWILRQDLRGKFSTQYNRLFFLGSEEQKKWRIIIIPLLVVLAAILIAALIYGAARKRRAEKAPPKYQKVIDAVTQRIEQEYKQEIDFSDLARTLGYSEPNLRKIFRQYTGATPLQRLITLRLNKARDMLETSDDTINEIMYSVGFSDPSYFIQSFKKRFGMTPSQWREKRGKSF